MLEKILLMKDCLLRYFEILFVVVFSGVGVHHAVIAANNEWCRG